MRFCKLIATKICHREKKNGKNVWGLFTIHSTLFSTIKLSFVFCSTSSVFALTLLAAKAKLVSVLEDEVYHPDTSRVEQFHSG